MQSDWAFWSPTTVDATALRPAALSAALAALNVWPVVSGAAPATPVPIRAIDAAAAAATPAPSTINFFMSDWPPLYLRIVDAASINPCVCLRIVDAASIEAGTAEYFGLGADIL